MKAFLRFLLAVPVFITGVVFFHATTQLDFGVKKSIIKALVIGIIAGVLIFTLICKFKKVYIFGHELAHWIFAKIFLKETQNFTVGKHGGTVQVKDPNVWVFLAPYFYPTFTILWMPTWFIFDYYKEKFPFGIYLFFGFLGVSWAYHLVLTLFALKFEQSDIQRCGRPLSFSIIFLFNMLFIFVFLAFLTSGPLDSADILWNTFCNDIQLIGELVYSVIEELM